METIKMKVKHVFLSTLAGAALLASTALANTNPSIITGGVGEASRAKIEAVQNQYSLKLVYTGKGGMYLSDVNVSITDKSGQVVATQTTEGPIMLVSLAPGRYTVESNYGGHVKKNTITVGSNLKTIQVGFPVADEPAPMGNASPTMGSGSMSQPTNNAAMPWNNTHSPNNLNQMAPASGNAAPQYAPSNAMGQPQAGMARPNMGNNAMASGPSANDTIPAPDMPYNAGEMTAPRANTMQVPAYAQPQASAPAASHSPDTAYSMPYPSGRQQTIYSGPGYLTKPGAATAGQPAPAVNPVPVQQGGSSAVY
jgi:hypothetical protein